MNRERAYKMIWIVGTSQFFSIFLQRCKNILTDHWNSDYKSANLADHRTKSLTPNKSSLTLAVFLGFEKCLKQPLIILVIQPCVLVPHIFAMLVVAVKKKTFLKPWPPAHRLGRLDCLVNNAGIFYTNADPKPLDEVRFVRFGCFGFLIATWNRLNKT